MALALGRELALELLHRGARRIQLIRPGLSHVSLIG
jgi:hypothetical protein